MANWRPFDNKPVACWLFSGFLLRKSGERFPIPDAVLDILRKDGQNGELDKRQGTYIIDASEGVEHEGRHGWGCPNLDCLVKLSNLIFLVHINTRVSKTLPEWATKLHQSTRMLRSGERRRITQIMICCPKLFGEWSLPQSHAIRQQYRCTKQELEVEECRVALNGCINGESRGVHVLEFLRSVHRPDAQNFFSSKFVSGSTLPWICKHYQWAVPCGEIDLSP